MKLIPMWANLDFALLPIGDNFTMGASDASFAAEWIGAKKVLGLHFDTFPFIEINKEQAAAYFNEKNIELILPEVNTTYCL